MVRVFEARYFGDLGEDAVAYIVFAAADAFDVHESVAAVDRECFNFVLGIKECREGGFHAHFVLQPVHPGFEIARIRVVICRRLEHRFVCDNAPLFQFWP